MRWRAALLAVVAALVSACSNGDEAGPTATVGTAAPTTATTDPYAVPEVIDVAYVNKVLAGLDQVSGDIARIVLQTRTIPPEAVDRLKTLYTGESLQLSLDLLQQDMRKGFSDYKTDPGNPKTTVMKLITAKPDCIFAEVRRDASELATTPRSPSTVWVSLRPLNPAADPNNYNPTRWFFAYDGFEQGRVQPADPCIAPS
ncbi:MAG: hypothetical protein M3179_12040 [Actinomycetota bacterium]|nr:hypothetical protein [Actinomycetota bacterium]